MATADGSGGRTLDRTTVTTGAPQLLDFAGTVYSHGWAVLEPNAWDAESEVLRRTERLSSGRVVHLEVSEATRGSSDPRIRIDVLHLGGLGTEDRREIRGSVRRMLRLDEDLGPFHARCRAVGGRWADASRGLGRLLRSPTLFEDVIKTICTTNIQWGGTRAMVRQLVQDLGEAGPASGGDGAFSSAFPTPARLAKADTAELQTARLGYRAPYVKELAERVVSGDLDLSALEDEHRSTGEVRKALLEIKGVGPYAAATLLMLLGRYDHLAIDSVYRTFVSERYFEGRRPSDAEAAAVYEDWGRWRYLGYWFDLWQGAEEDV